jgi:asparagine synthetase B (glutamine-hydrolysing)
MIAGVLRVDRTASPDVLRRGISPDVQTAGDDVLQVGWTHPVVGGDDDGLLVLIDGVLWPLGSDPHERVRDGWRSEGAQFVTALRGAFTILVWDRERQVGVLASDQVSMRNCYLHEENGTLRFSTHLPAMRRMLPRTPPPNPGVVATWLAGQSFLQGHDTMLQGVRRLGNAALLELGPRGWQRRRYWTPQWRGTATGEPSDHVAALRDGLERAIRLRADPGAPTAVMLSGGFDSSAVTAVAAQTGARLRAYSTVFPAHRWSDESSRINAMVEALGIPGAAAALEPQGGLRHAAEYLRDWGMVPGGPGGIVEEPLLRRAAADGLRVVLDGQGGDELFGFSPYLLADRLMEARLFSIRRLLNRIPDVPGRPDRHLLRTMLVDFMLDGALDPRLQRLRQRLPGVRPPKPPPAYLRAHSKEHLAAQGRWKWKRSGVPRWWAWHLYLLTEAREGSQHAEYIWQRGARHGLIPAAVLLDVDLVELVLRLPPDLAWRRLNRPVARAAVRDVMPAEVLANTTKANIGFFYLDLMTGADYAIARELLLDPDARVLEWVDPVALRELVERRPSHRDSQWLGWMTPYWRLLTGELFLRWLEDASWLDRFLERDDLPSIEAKLSFS